MVETAKLLNHSKTVGRIGSFTRILPIVHSSRRQRLLLLQDQGRDWRGTTLRINSLF
ncbi:MAG: hypothetical protein QOJ15_2271 [Bradyrhizobium sp.]|nr:hypothetical protein [Bradyrhizobium sp.]